MTEMRVDLAVIGAGPAGLSAATEVSRRGGDVVILDEAPLAGGRLPAQIHRSPGCWHRGRPVWSNGRVKAGQMAQAARQADARIICGVSVWGVFPGWHVAAGPVDPSLADGSLPRIIHAGAVLIATGAAQNPMVFPGWTLPGVITAGAAQAMLNIHRILPGRRAVLAGIDPLTLSAAHIMAEAGARVLGILLPPPESFGPEPKNPEKALEALWRLARYAYLPLDHFPELPGGRWSRFLAKIFPRDGISIAGFPIKIRKSVVSAHGQKQVESVTVASLHPDGTPIAGTTARWETDVIITSAGLYPLAELAQTAGCPLVHVPELGGWVPRHNDRYETPLAGLFVAGSVTGVEGAEVASAQGLVAGTAICLWLSLGKKDDLERALEAGQRAVEKSRRKSLPFHPDVEKGRSLMNGFWR